MGTFEESWELLVSTLKTDAATLQVPEYAIEEGKNEEPTSAPFIWVYCLPAVKRVGEAGGKLRRMNVSVFCGSTGTDLASAMKSALALAERVETSLENVKGFTTFDIRYDDMYSDKTVVELIGSMSYAKS